MDSSSGTQNEDAGKTKALCENNFGITLITNFDP